MHIKLSKEEIDKRSETLTKLEASVKIIADAADMIGVDPKEEEMDEDDMMVQAQIRSLAYALNDIVRSIEYLRQDIDSMYKILFSHMESGHLPAVKSAEQMARAINKLGLGDEYEVQKKMIYASTGRGTLTIG